MAKEYGVSHFVMDSGERYCLVVDRATGLPLYYPNLYLMTQLRNRSLAAGTVAAEAEHLVTFLCFLDRRQIDLQDRLLKCEFFKDFELDALRDFTQWKRRRSAGLRPRSDSGLDLPGESSQSINTGTHHARLTAAADYLAWFSKHLLVDAGQGVVEQIEAVSTQIKARRPVKRGRNDDRLDKSLTDEQLEVLFEAIRPGSALNPFTELVQRRNRLIILLLFHLGIRGGELRKIRIRDIDFSKNQLRISRTADEKADPRVHESNAKTRGRLLPLGDALVGELHRYIARERRELRSASRHDFLIVTHKAGPDEGKPISKGGYWDVISGLRDVYPQLIPLTGHMLRHTWNRKFSEKMDSMDSPPSPERQEQLRSFLMGWKDGSGTAAIYNRRFIEKKGQEAALRMQTNNGTRLPRNLVGEC